MKTTTIAILIALCMPMAAGAQTGAAKKAAESVFTLTTFKADGTLLATSHGVFVGNDGEAVSNLKPFEGAETAIAVDTKGLKHNVTRMLGADDIYNVARFRVDGKTKGATLATTQAQTGQTVWLATYAGKRPQMLEAKPTGVEKFNGSYNFCIFNMDAPENTEGCPFINEQGQVVGLMQLSTTGSDIHSTDAAYAMQLKTSALSVNDATLRKIGITAALPADKEQATLALMLTQQSGSEKKLQETADDFIAAFPQLTDGYVAKAQQLVNANRFAEAQAVMDDALKNAEKKDDAHYQTAKLMYLKMTYKAETEFKPWTWETALDECNKAYAIQQLDIYKDLEGQILYGKGDYEKAYSTFMKLTEGKLKNADLYYNAALCQNMLKSPDSVVVALLDSAVNNVDSLNFREAAKYFIMRGDVYNRMGNYRQAVFDYTRYEVVSGRNCTADFYYLREQTETKAKLFKQALVDIDNAIYLDPKEQTYQAEKAALQLRLNMLKEALEAAKACMENFPDCSDAYLVAGIVEIRQGDKSSGLAKLRKAKEMGNAQADALIAKYN